jgi:tetratricopeptide (TPR) repeat protein
MNKVLQLIAVFFLLVGCVVSCRTMNVETLCNHALSKYEKQDYQGALEDLAKAMLLDPDCAATYVLRAEIRKKQGAWTDAIADYNQAIKLLLKTGVKEALAAAYINRGAIKKGIGNYDGAIDAYTKSLQAHSNFTSIALTKRGEAKLRKGDYSGATADCSKAIELDGGSYSKQQVLAGAYYGRGAARAMQANLKGSISDLDKAIELYQSLNDHPKLGLSHRERGFSKRKKGDHKGAIADYNKAIAFLEDTNDASELSVAFAQRGLEKHRKNDYRGAIDDYSKAIELNPGLVEVFFNRAMAKTKQRKYDGAISDYGEVIRLLEGSNKETSLLAAAYGERGNVKSKINDLDGAIADYDKMVVICRKIADKQKLALAYINRAGAKTRNKDLDGAVADYTEVILSDPRNTHALLGRGLVRQMQGLLDDAIPDLLKASEVNPKLPEAWQLLAYAYSKKRDRQNCLQALKKVLELLPEWGAMVMKRGGEFDWLRDDPEFKKLIDK